MIKFNCTYKVKHNFNKIEAIPKKLSQTISESVEEMLKNIRGYAIRLEKSHKEDGIIVEMIDMSANKTKGRVYADPSKFMTENGQSYLFFEYFGTGQYAEQDHIGKTKHFIESGYTEWYIPIDKVSRTLNYPIITINNRQFYVAVGAKANHFLSDAEFESRNENIEIVKKKIEEMLKEVCK